MSITFNNAVKPEHRLIVFSLIGIIFFAAALRFYKLGSESFHGDEIIMAYTTTHTDSFHNELSRGRPPVYVILGYAWTQLFGSSETATRSLSALLGILAIPLTYTVAAELFDRRIGIISAILMAVSGFQVWHSQTFRYYILVVVLSLLAVHFYILAVRQGGVRNFLAFILFSALIGYTHPLGALVLVGWGMHFMLRWQSYKSRIVPWVISQVTILVLFVPLILHFSSTVSGMASGEPDAAPGAVEKTSLRNFLWTPVELMLGEVFRENWREFFIPAVLLITCTGLFVLFTLKRSNVAQFRGDIQSLFRTKGDQLLLVFCWGVLPAIILYLASTVVGSMYAYRYLAPITPALYIIFAIIMVTAQRLLPSSLSLGVVAVIALLTLQMYYTNPQKTEWRQMVEYIEANKTETDMVLYADDIVQENLFDTTTSPLGWYYEEPPACYVPIHLSLEEVTQQLEACVPLDFDRVWIFFRRKDSEDFRQLFPNIENLTDTDSLADDFSEGYAILKDLKFMNMDLFLFQLGTRQSQAVAQTLNVQ